MANIAFPNMFDASSGKTMLVYGNDACRQSLKCWLLTNVRELLGDPLFGSSIKELLYEPRNSFLKTRINQRLEAISDKIPQIKILTDLTQVVEGDDDVSQHVVIHFSNKVTGATGIIKLVASETGSIIAE